MSAAHQATILAVEDDGVQAVLYRQVLGRPDWQVLVAPTLAEATHSLNAHRVSLILLDLFLPDGDGREWLRALRDRPEHALTPVIVVAGSSVVEAQVDCYELGAATMLSKPVAPEVLLAAVSGAMQRVAARRGESRSVRGDGARASDAPPQAGARVLLAEDDNVVAALVQHRLTREGFEVERHTDGASALDAARGRNYALAILDVLMPGLDGFELLTALRRLPGKERLPIIMLTGLHGEREVERALALGASDYVLKPFSPVELTARVQRLLKRH